MMSRAALQAVVSSAQNYSCDCMTYFSLAPWWRRRQHSQISDYLQLAEWSIAPSPLGGCNVVEKPF